MQVRSVQSIGGGGVCTGLLSWGLLIEITHASIRRDHLKFGSNAVGAGKLQCMDSGIDIQLDTI